MKIFHVGSHEFRESLRELLRELWSSYCSSREMPFREWNFVFREWKFEFRELLREYPGTLRELREWPFHSESIFPEIGVVPRLLILEITNLTRNSLKMSSLRAVRAISMSRAKNSLPIVPRQFLSLSYPLGNCPLNCPLKFSLKVV